MTYSEWRSDHTYKLSILLSKLNHLPTSEVAEYFIFENMAISNPDFCGLYATNTKCHDTPYLNCFNCGCPYFEYTDSSEGLYQEHDLTIMSTCTINAKEGKRFLHNNIAHQDCSDCHIPHSRIFTEKSIDDFKLTQKDIHGTTD